jgi:hypothetical protein
MMQWAFAPPKPKLLILDFESVMARRPSRLDHVTHLDLRGWPLGTSGQGSHSVGMRRYFANGLRSGFKRLKWRFGGINECRRAKEAFRIPAIPAQPSVCPIMVLIEPTSSSPSAASWFGKKTLSRAYFMIRSQQWEIYKKYKNKNKNQKPWFTDLRLSWIAYRRARAMRLKELATVGLGRGI